MRSLTVTAIFVCLALAISVVWVRHENRVAFIELQNVYESRDHYNREWRRLLIERASFASRLKLRSFAETNLGMRVPVEYSLLRLREHGRWHAQQPQLAFSETDE